MNLLQHIGLFLIVFSVAFNLMLKDDKNKFPYSLSVLFAIGITFLFR